MNTYEKWEYEEDTNKRAKRTLDWFHILAVIGAWACLFWIFAIVGGCKGKPGTNGLNGINGPTMYVYQGPVPSSGIFYSANITDQSEITVYFMAPGGSSWTEIGSPTMAGTEPWCLISVLNHSVYLYNLTTSCFYKIIILNKN